jgi:hypothetical protein
MDSRYASHDYSLLDENDQTSNRDRVESVHRETEKIVAWPVCISTV